MKLELRQYTREDIPALTTVANDKEVSKYLRDIFPYPYTVEDAERFIAFVIALEEDKGIEYAIFVDDCFAGAIGMSFSVDIYQKTCEIGYWLGTAYWGKGIMSKAIKAITDYTFHNYPVHKITAEVLSPNIGSARALEKNGFQLEATLKEHVYKHNQFYDVLIYSLFRQ